MNITTVGDADYFPTMLATSEQLAKFHPDADFYVYDWGLELDQVTELEEWENTTVIEWDISYEFNTFEKVIAPIEKVLRYDKSPTQRLYYRWLTNSEGYREVWGPLRRRREYYLKERIYCMLDCIERIEEQLVFLDADAFPVAPLDIMNEDFDIGVTLRPKEETEKAKAKGKYYVLNGGVVFFNTTAEKIRGFLKHWAQRANECDIELQEQTSLSRIIAEAGDDIYVQYHSEGTLTIGEYEYSVKVVPCTEWNYYWPFDSVDEIDPKQNRILHLKGGRYGKYDVQKIIDDIDATRK